MKRYVALVLPVVLHHFHNDNAHACGETPYLLQSLLPQVNAQDVVIDAALIAASNSNPIAFTLRKVSVANVVSDGGEPVGKSALAPDSGLGNIHLNTLCYEARGGYLCVAKPGTVLEPHTTYEWSTSVPLEDLQQPGGGLESGWQLFTTSDVAATNEAIAVDATVLDYAEFDMHPCGQSNAVTLNVEADHLEQSLVVNVQGLTPSNVTLPLVLSPQLPKQEFGLSSIPECFTLEAFDSTGAQHTLQQLCPAALLPHATSDNSDNSAAPTGAPPEIVAPSAPSEDMVDNVFETSVDAPSVEVDHGEVNRRGITQSNTGCAIGFQLNSVPVHALLVGLVAVVGLIRTRTRRRLD